MSKKLCKFVMNNLMDMVLIVILLCVSVVSHCYHHTRVEQIQFSVLHFRLKSCFICKEYISMDSWFYLSFSLNIIIDFMMHFEAYIKFKCSKCSPVFLINNVWIWIYIFILVIFKQALQPSCDCFNYVIEYTWEGPTLCLLYCFWN